MEISSPTSADSCKTANSSSSNESPPTKRFKIELISSSSTKSDPESRLNVALNPDSSNVPDELRCPICFEVPLAEIFQCPNGHIICKDCQDKCRTNVRKCAQCKVSLEAKSGGLIRNRALENLLDTMWFSCPYQSDGCLLTFSRPGLREHTDTCQFSGNCVQFCQYLDFPFQCDYWLCSATPKKTVDHFWNVHWSNDLIELRHEPKFATFWFTITFNGTSTSHPPVLFKAFNAYFLVATRQTLVERSGDYMVSFICFRLDKEKEGKRKGDRKTQIRFTIKSQTVKIPSLTWKCPVGSVLDADTELKKSAHMISLSCLKENFMKDCGNSLTIDANLYQ